MDGQGRLVEATGYGAVGLLVFLGVELRFRPLPKRARLVDLARGTFLADQLDGKQDVIRIGAHDALEVVGLKIFLCFLFKVQDHFGSAQNPRGLLLARRRDLELGASRRAPDPDLAGAGTAADHLDAVGDHKGGVKTHAELPDEARAVLRLRKPADECPRARARYRPEVLDELLSIHADA